MAVWWNCCDADVNYRFVWRPGSRSLVGRTLASSDCFPGFGFGAHLTQTAGLALAADRASDKTRPQVVALLYVMFLVGMGLAALTFGFLLYDFTKLKLIQVVQGAAVVTLLLNIVALGNRKNLFLH